MNVKLLRKIQLSILREPKRYDQANWAGKPDEMSKDGSCGTIGCLAGWACANELGKQEYIQNYIFDGNQGNIEEDACDYLDIEYQFVGGKSGRLFHANQWPRILKWLFVPKDGYGNLKGNRYWRMVAAVVRIEVFIWSGGRV